MLPSTTIFAISRTLGYPIIGDIELVQLCMVLLIVGSMAYTELTNSHISIGIIVDKFKPRTQKIFDVIGQFLTTVFCILICWVFISKMNFNSYSDLLNIPISPFKIFLIIGFFSWGLQSLLKLIKSYQSLNVE